MAGFDVAQLLGPFGGQLALAFGTGCAAGYAFCLRTVYKLLSNHKEKEHEECMERITKLEENKAQLQERLKVLEDRWYMGATRQQQQMRESSIAVLGADKLGEGYLG